MSESPVPDLPQTGVPGEPFFVRITPRDTERYAAAVGDMNRLFFADEEPDRMVIPPMFASSCTGWDKHRQPETNTAGNRHVIEYIEQYGPCHLPPQGMTLRVIPQLTAVIPKEGGCLAIWQYDVFAADTDTLCCRNYHGELLPRITGSTASGTPPLIPVYHAKAALWERKIRILPQQCYLYDAAAPAVPEQCLSPKAAHAAGLSKPVLPNDCLLALCVRELVRHELHGRADKVTAIYAHFKAPVFPDSHILLELLGREKNTHCEELHFRVRTTDGTIALSRGYLKADI